MSAEWKKKEKLSWNLFLSRPEIFMRESSKPYSYGILWTYVYRKNFEIILRYIGNARNRVVLEIGFGGGWLSEWLALEGANVVGIDISSEFCRALKMRATDRGFDVHVLCADGESLPFRENSFYVSVTYEALHHLPNPDKAIGEALTASERFVCGDEPAEFLLPRFLVRLLKIFATSRIDTEELSGIRATRFEPLKLAQKYQKTGYQVAFEKQWSMVPTILLKTERSPVVRTIYETAYEFLMGMRAIRNMGHGFTMIIKRAGEFDRSGFLRGQQKSSYSVVLFV